MHSSRHLSHDFPAWKGLSLRALFFLVLLGTSSNTLFFIGFGLIMGYPLFMGCIGFLFSFILSITVYPKLLAQLKKDKPHRYLLKTWLLGLSHLGLIKSPWVHYEGVWQKTKSLGVRDV